MRCSPAFMRPVHRLREASFVLGVNRKKVHPLISCSCVHLVLIYRYSTSCRNLYRVCTYFETGSNSTYICFYLLSSPCCTLPARAHQKRYIHIISFCVNIFVLFYVYSIIVVVLVNTIWLSTKDNIIRINLHKYTSSCPLNLRKIILKNAMLYPTATSDGFGQKSPIQSQIFSIWIYMKV